ncbi:MFS transporter [Rathayibacter oskolensis]|uniref:MFS transporter n=1 Tax=Rathayibacter oskolensis TaxID=1891671 RepID=UPI00265FBC9F|nr:MFS transporter [Rathayibacter oskolensis]WKK72747.1 MFS transporter [Rathayibacter oskolensis]
MFLGLIVLALALAEGSAGDWLPLIMVDGHGASATVGSLVFAGFALAMTIGRFSGEPLLARFGKPAVLCVSALVSAAGIALVVFSDSVVVAGLAVLLWGLGAALGFPVTLSAAGEATTPPRRSARSPPRATSRSSSGRRCSASSASTTASAARWSSCSWWSPAPPSSPPRRGRRSPSRPERRPAEARPARRENRRAPLRKGIQLLP